MTAEVAQSEHPLDLLEAGGLRVGIIVQEDQALPQFVEGRVPAGQFLKAISLIL